MSWSLKVSMNWSLMFDIQVYTLIGTYSNIKYTLSSSSSTEWTLIMLSCFNLLSNFTFSISSGCQCRRILQFFLTKTFVFYVVSSSHSPKGQCSFIESITCFGIFHFMSLEVIDNSIILQNLTIKNIIWKNHHTRTSQRFRYMKLIFVDWVGTGILFSLFCFFMLLSSCFAFSLSAINEGTLFYFL